MTSNIYSVNGPLFEVHLNMVCFFVIREVIIYLAPLCATELELIAPALHLGLGFEPHVTFGIGYMRQCFKLGHLNNKKKSLDPCTHYFLKVST